MDILKDNDCFMEVVFSRKWKQVSIIRMFIQNFLTANISEWHQTSPDRVSMAAGELMENAVKYSVSDEIRISLSISGGENPYMKIRVENTANDASIRAVTDLYNRVMTGDAFETYVSMMRDAATRGDEKSQLGLIRIRYESGCRLLLETLRDKVGFSLEL